MFMKIFLNKTQMKDRNFSNKKFKLLSKDNEKNSEPNRRENVIK